MAITKAQQFCTEVQVCMSQKEEEEPQEVGRCLTRKYVLAMPICHTYKLLSLSIMDQGQKKSLTTSPTRCSTLVVMAMLWIKVYK